MMDPQKKLKMLKRQAKMMHKALPDVCLGQCQHALAKSRGYSSWACLREAVLEGLY